MSEPERPFTEFAGKLAHHHRAWIAAVRQPRGLDYLARHAGISRSALYSWFSGRHLPQEALLARLLKALGVAEPDRLALLRLRARLVREGAPEPDGRFARPLPGPPTEPGRFSGREWAVRRILDWRDRPGHLLLVTAEPGGGKTRLATHLAHTVGGVAALHYCRQRDTGSLDPIGVVEHLARQLAGSVTGFSEALATVTGTDSDTALESGLRTELNPRLAFDRFIRRPLTLAAAPSTVVVIDGFDEAAEGDTGRQLASMLVREAHQPAPGLKLLITSRPVPLLDAFPECERLDLVEDETVTGADVLAYTCRRLAPHLADAEPVARSIAEHSSGNFLYASFIVDDLLDSGRPAGDRASIPLPDGLAALYREFLDRELAADPGRWRTRYRPVLGLLTQARGNGLGPSQLAELTGQPPSIVDDVLDLCAPYLQRATPDGPVRLFHLSFADYLRRAGRHHTYPDEAAERLFDWAARPGRDAHATRHLLEYALDALALAGERARPAVLGLLASLTADTAFLHTRSVSDGAASLTVELNRVVEASGCTDQAVLRLAKILAAQDVALRGWDPVAEPGRWLQQIRYQAVRDGDTALVAALDTHSEPPARVLWTHGARSRAEHGHNDTVSCVAVRDDGVSASGSYDMTVRVLDPCGRTLHLLHHPGPVTDVGFVGERWLAVAFDHHLVHLWDLADTAAPQVLGHDDRVTRLLATGSGALVAGSEDGTARVWEPGRRLPRHTFRHGGPVTGLADAGRYLVTASGESCAHLWDLADGTLHARVGDDGPVRHVAASPERVAWAVGGRVVLWDLATGSVLGDTDVAAPVTGLAFAPDGTLLIAEAHRVHRWCPSAEAVLVAEHADQVTVAVPHGTSVLSASRDKTVRLTRRDGTVRHFRHDGWIRDADASGEVMVTGSDDRGVRAWDPRTGAALWELPGDTDSVLSLAYSRDGSHVLAGSADGTLRVHDAATGGLRHVLPHDGPVKAVVEHEGLLLTGDTTAARIWSNLDRPATPIHDGPVTSAVALPAGLAAIGGADGHAAIWDLPRGALVADLKGHTAAVTAVAGNERLIVSCSADGTARVWDTTTGHELRVLEHAAEVRGAAIGADGSILTTCLDGIVRLWPPHGAQFREPGRHAAPAKAVAAARAFAVTGSRDQTARIWSLPDGRPLPVLHHDGWVRDVAVAADAQRILTCSDDRTARWWNPADGTERHRFTCRNRISRIASHPSDPGLAVLGTTQGEVLAIRVRVSEGAGCATGHFADDGFHDVLKRP